MTLRLTLRRPFVADHFHDVPAFREARHGHNWELEATALLERPEEEQGFAEALDAWVHLVDYTLLNDQPALSGRNPTAEALAGWVFAHLEMRGLVPERTKVREKANYWAVCRRLDA